MTKFEQKVLALLSLIAYAMSAKLPYGEETMLRDRIKQIVDVEDD